MRSAVVALALGLVLALVGCSGDDGPSSAPSVSATPASSVACPSPVAPAASALRSSVTTADGERTYYVWTPTGYDGTKPAPLVVDYHGLGQDALDYATKFSGMVRDGLTRGYLVVAPQSKGVTWGAPGYAVVDDVAFTQQLLQVVEATYCVDPQRVYAAGFSAGGGFTTYVSCVLDVWAAVAPQSGVNFARPCTSRPAVPAIVWHGRADTINPFGDEDATTEPPPSPDQSYLGDVAYDVDQWAVRNGCQTTRVDTVVNADVTRRTYDCPAGEDVVLYVHTGGHTLPGGVPLDAAGTEALGPQVTSVNGPTVTLDFFDAHVRAAPPAATPAPTDTDGLLVG